MAVWVGGKRCRNGNRFRKEHLPSDDGAVCLACGATRKDLVRIPVVRLEAFALKDVHLGTARLVEGRWQITFHVNGLKPLEVRHKYQVEHLLRAAGAVKVEEKRN